MIQSLYSRRPPCVFLFLCLLSNSAHYYGEIHTLGSQNPQPSSNVYKKKRSVNTELPTNAHHDSHTQPYCQYPSIPFFSGPKSLDRYPWPRFHGYVAVVLPGLTRSLGILSPALLLLLPRAPASRPRSLFPEADRSSWTVWIFNLDEVYTLKSKCQKTKSKYQKKTARRMKKEFFSVDRKFRQKILAGKKRIPFNKLQSTGHVYKGHTDTLEWCI